MHLLQSFTQALVGGGLIGVAAGLFRLINGRTLGISGLVASIMERWNVNALESALVLLGLPLGVVLYEGIGGHPRLDLNPSLWVLAAGGALVGIGAGMAGGCTSGHAVCGLARLSKRSLAATALFMGCGAAVVGLGRLL